MPKSEHHVAYFITPHGFGHAARAAAVMSALAAQNVALHFEIFTLVPRWFFEDSIPTRFTYHRTLTDIGLVQVSSLREDLRATVRQLQDWVPFTPERIAPLVRRLQRLHCELVLCDISPLGIAAARAAGLPSLLIENFTWDWIYRGYARSAPALRRASAYLNGVFATVDHHVQTEPVCLSQPAALVTRPVSRERKTPARVVRAQLGIPARAKVILITMGGIPEQHAFLDRLAQVPHVYFVIPGASSSVQRRGNLILLPHRSNWYHPDLLNASDAVVGKAGYSTVAEAYHAGVPFGYILRRSFRESPVLGQFIQAHMRGVEIAEEDFRGGAWLSILPDLLAFPRVSRGVENGARPIARFVRDLLKL